MPTIRSSDDGVDYLPKILKDAKTVRSKAVFFRIPRNDHEPELCLKIGRYKKGVFGNEDGVEIDTPKSELTLDSEELKSLIEFISNNHEALKSGAKRYVTIDDYDAGALNLIRGFFGNSDRSEVLKVIIQNNLLSSDIINGLRFKQKVDALQEFERMLTQDGTELSWQNWFSQNDWIFGTEFSGAIGERRIDPQHIADFLMKSCDGFLDIIEIKKPSKDLPFWAATQDHGNYVPSSDLIKAITQSMRYIHQLESKMDSKSFSSSVDDTPVIKPRCTLIYGRSCDWNSEQKEAYRILNSSFYNISILTYDHVLKRARCILNNGQSNGVSETVDTSDCPF